MRLFTGHFLVIGTLLKGSQASKLYSNATIPTNITAACSEAFFADVDCDAAVTSLDPNNYFDQGFLTKTCTESCNQGLSTFEANIVKNCASQAFGGEENWDLTRNPVLPVAVIPNKLRYDYGLTCLMDSGRFCNVVAWELAEQIDQDEPEELQATRNRTVVNTGNATHIGQNSTQLRVGTAADCDLCFIKSLRYQAAAPYGAGPYLQEDSIYQSMTSSCSVANLPPTTWSLPYSTTTTASQPAPSCGGSSYEIVPGDTCYSVSKSQSIGTAWLLMDNNLFGSCADFPTSGKLCIQSTCKIQEVKENATCKSIAQENGITVSQLRSWNLILNSVCDNVSKLNGTYLCVSNPGTTYITPTITIINPTTATTKIPAPTQTGEDSNPNCGQWHIATIGEYCNILTYKYHIALPDFIFLNPSINENCTNLWADYAYCVQPVGDINTYTGRPGYSIPITTMPNTLIWDNLPNPTYSTPSPTTTLQPLATGVRKDCAEYFSGSLFPDGIEGEPPIISACELAAMVFSVSLFDLSQWNVGLNTSSPDCTFDTTARYCGQWYDGDPPAPTEPTAVLLPIREDTISNCTEYASVRYHWTCETVLTVYALTIAQFYEWNPAIGPDCSNLWINYRYCVRTPDYEEPTPTISDPSTPTATPGIPSPVQDGQPENCNNWHKVIAGDGCWSIANEAFITLEQFYSWNPAVGSECANGVWLGYYYCTGTTDSGQPTRSSSSSLPSSTTAPPAPSPTQDNNIISSCNKYDKAIAGDGCWVFADRNAITLVELGTWNALLKPDSSGCDSFFWLDFYYCVGVKS